MSSNSIFTRKRMGLDNNVWISLLACILLSAGLLGYTVNRHGERKECKPMNIVVNGRVITEIIYFKTGEPLTFRTPISPGDRIVWDFGDETQKMEGFSAIHIYGHEGRFSVRATVNGICAYDKKVNIEKASEMPIDTAGNVLENISGKEEAMVGENIMFFTTLPASKYEWFVENNRNYPVQNGKQANFIFKSQGSYTIVLMLDHDIQRKLTKKIIVSRLPTHKDDYVTPVPLIPIPVPVKVEQEVFRDTSKHTAPVEAPKKKYKNASDEILKAYLQSIVCKGMKAEEFDDYLCQGVNTPVVINDKERKNFLTFYSEIQGKKIKIESVTAKREGDNCATILHIKYDKKGFLGKNPCKN